MKKNTLTIIAASAALLAIILLLAALAAGAARTTAAPAAPAAPTPREEPDLEPVTFTDAEVDQFGRDTCTVLHGYGIETGLALLVSEGTKAGLEERQTIALIAAAIREYCPTLSAEITAAQ